VGAIPAVCLPYQQWPAAERGGEEKVASRCEGWWGEEEQLWVPHPERTSGQLGEGLLAHGCLCGMPGEGGWLQPAIEGEEEHVRGGGWTANRWRYAWVQQWWCAGAGGVAAGWCKNEAAVRCWRGRCNGGRIGVVSRNHGQVGPHGCVRGETHSGQPVGMDWGCRWCVVLECLRCHRSHRSSRSPGAVAGQAEEEAGGWRGGVGEGHLLQCRGGLDVWGHMEDRWQRWRPAGW
jgi:hypothetical protein